MSFDWPTLILGAAVAMLLQYLIVWLDALVRSRRGELHGRWYEVLPAEGDQNERRDHIVVHQRGNELRIKVKRYFPPEEAGRRWRMLGHAHGNTIVGVFYTTTAKKDPSSYGTIVLHRDMKEKYHQVWPGTYIRPDGELAEVIWSGSVGTRAGWWQRDDPIRFRYQHPRVERENASLEIGPEQDPNDEGSDP